MGQQNGIGWIAPRHVARSCGSPAELMHAAAAELQRRWADGDYDTSVEEVLEVRRTLTLIAEVLGDGLMSALMADLAGDAALHDDAGEMTRKAGWEVGSAARQLTTALRHLESDPGQLSSLVRAGW
jgi:hypothetical protein